MTTPPAIIDVSGVSKRFILHKDKSVKERIVNLRRSRRHRDDFWALRDVDLQVSAGSTVGLVGHNGSGKSTLLKVIGGIIEPTSGTVRRRGRLAALLELGAGFHADLTGRENVYLNAAILGLSRKETDRYFDAIVDFSGIEEFIDTQVKFYSSGMYVRLAFAVAVHVDPDLLLVDEVLAVGDEPFQRKCLEKISDFQQEGRTIVFVSHSADQVGSLCDRVVVLNHGGVVHDGDTAEGLRVLRAGFDADREARLERQDAPTADEGVTIDRVDVRSDRLLPNGVIASASDLTVDIDFTVSSAPAGWIAGIAIETPLGQPVYRVNTEGLGVELPREAGTYSARFELPRNAFGGGQFLVNVGLVAPDGRPLDRRRPAASFFIEDDPSGVGLVRFDTRFAVSGGSSA
ncbi:ABC transporter ATP-binding protein [Agromyces sp. SYSU T00266]|uniref:ABC transporter ATP-binding protein n=1 Tax=Agromyces zhanjiangensis TaxID=3158562 RepID=UPI0033949BA0